jgi:nucleoside-diphosphate-sugar epimerase
VVVIGATGRLGQTLVAALQASTEHTPVGMARSGDPELEKSGVEVCVADVATGYSEGGYGFWQQREDCPQYDAAIAARVEAVRRAIAGADTVVFAATAPDGCQDERLVRAIDVNGVRDVVMLLKPEQRFVLVSGRLVDAANCPEPEVRAELNARKAGVMDAKWDAEQVGRSRVGFARNSFVLRPGALLSSPMPSPPEESARPWTPVPDGFLISGLADTLGHCKRAEFRMSRSDVARVIVAALSNWEQASGKTVEVVARGRTPGESDADAWCSVAGIFARDGVLE